MREHYEDGAKFNENQEFWKSISGITTDEGYMSNENFQKGVETFQRLRESGLSSLEGDERDEFDRRTRWILEIKA